MASWKKEASWAKISRIQGRKNKERIQRRENQRERERIVRWEWSRKKGEEEQEGQSGRKWPVQGGCNHLGFRYIENHRYNTQPPCVFHLSPMVPSHVLLYKIEKRACISTHFCEHRPKISSPLVVHRDSFPSLFSFPHTPRLAIPHSPDASLRFFRLLLLPLLIFVSRFQFISNFSFFLRYLLVINLIQLMEENETCLDLITY